MASYEYPISPFSNTNRVELVLVEVDREVVGVKDKNVGRKGNSCGMASEFKLSLGKIWRPRGLRL